MPTDRECAIARRMVKSAKVGGVVVMKRSGLRQGLLGRAERNAGVVIRKRPPFGLVIQRVGLKHPESWWAGYWRLPDNR